VEAESAEKQAGASRGKGRRRAWLIAGANLALILTGGAGLWLGDLDERADRDARALFSEASHMVEEIQSRPAPRELEAAYVYEDAFVNLGVSYRAERDFRRALQFGELEIDSQPVSEYLELNARALELLAEAAESSSCCFVSDYSREARSQLPSRQGVRASVSLLMVAARAAVRRGRSGEAAARVRQALHLARSVQKTRLVLGFELGGECEDIVAEGVKAALTESEPGPACLRTLSRAIDGHLSARPDLADCVEVERATGLLTAAESMVSGKRWRRGRRAGRQVTVSLHRLRGGMVRDARAVSEFWAKSERAMAAGYPQRLKRLTDLRCDGRLFGRMRRLRSPFAGTLPSFVSASRTDARRLALLHAARLALGCRLVRARTGAFPGKLAELTEALPDLFPEVPNDPFSGKPMLYRRTGGGFVVYSVGSWDRKDDGAPNLFENTHMPDLTFAVDPEGLRAYRRARTARRGRYAPPVAMVRPVP
jgi:hypothetical protein